MLDTPVWRYDSVIPVDRVHVIESLPADQQSWYYRTGRRLFDELQDVCATTPAVPKYHRLQTVAELHAVLQQVLAEAQAGHYPLLHFETHGLTRPAGRYTTSSGLFLGSNEVISWLDLAPTLVAINGATRLSLIVFMSACYGADIATLFQPLQPAPARAVIGPMRSIEVPEIDAATAAFYRTMFRTRDAAAATIAMNNTLDPAKGLRFWVFVAERMFLDILKGYFNDATNEPAIAARVERFIGPMALQGVPSAVLAVRRDAMKAFLRNRKAVFDTTYRSFFMTDNYPEIAKRFQMTFESCFTDTAAEDGPL